MNPETRRPVFLNLFRIRFPLTAIVSILHRITGVVLIIVLPLAVYLFDLSLSGAQGYQQALSILRTPLFELIGILFVWALAHHLIAGVRFLLLDLDIGISKQSARTSALIVIILAILIAMVYAWSLV